MFTQSVVPLIEAYPNCIARWIYIPTSGLNSSLLSIMTQEQREKIVSLLHPSVKIGFGSSVSRYERASEHFSSAVYF